MSYGLLLHNLAGDVLVDSQYSNYSLLASGTINTGTTTTVNFAATGSIPLVFARLQSTTHWVALTFLSQTQAVFTTFGSPSLPDINYRTFSPAVIEYMVFGLARSLPTSGSDYGLQVFDDAGLLVYDSNVLTPRVRQVVSVASLVRPVSGVNMQPTTNVAHALGGSPWFLVNPTLFYYGHIYQSGSTAQMFRPCLRSNSDGTIGFSVGFAADIGTFGFRWPTCPMVTALIA